MASSLITLLIYIVVIGLIFWVLWWALDTMGVPEPFNKVIRVILILVAALLVINLLLGILPAGHSLRLGSWAPVLTIFDATPAA